MAADRGTPARSRFRTAVRRKSWGVSTVPATSGQNSASWEHPSGTKDGACPSPLGQRHRNDQLSAERLPLLDLETLKPLGNVRLYRLRSGEVSDGPGLVTLLTLRDPASVERDSLRRIESQGGIIVADGVIQATALQVDEGSTIESVRIVGAQPQGLV